MVPVKVMVPSAAEAVAGSKAAPSSMAAAAEEAKRMALLRTEAVEVFILCPFRHMSLYEKGNAIKENDTDTTDDIALLRWQLRCLRL